MAKILFVADAFSRSYITDSLLADLEKDGYTYRTVEQPAGFCERLPLIASDDVFIPCSAISYNGKVFKRNYFLNFLDYCSRLSPRAGYLLRRVWNKLFRRKKMRLYNIPFSLTPYFELIEDRLIAEQLKSGKANINLQFFTSMVGTNFGDDKSRLRNLEKYLSDNENTNEVIYLYYSILDRLGHQFGPADDRVKIEAERTLDLFKQLVDKFSAHDFFLLGDHGMAAVSQFENYSGHLQKILKKKFIFLKDYILFCDSTQVRIWAKDDATLNNIFSVLNGQKKTFGQGLHNIQMVNGKNSSVKNDFIRITLKSGWMVWPDFFFASYLSQPKGMHGYFPSDTNLEGILIAQRSCLNSYDLDGTIQLKRVFQIVVGE